MKWTKIKEFYEYASKNNIITLAEKNGGGYEWGAGWEKGLLGL